MRRALIVAFAAALVIVPTAGAWTWPVKGPVLQKFVLGDDPYAAGQHRGIDIGAGAGEPVLAPASGLVSFAGTVRGSSPRSGRTDGGCFGGDRVPAGAKRARSRRAADCGHASTHFRWPGCVAGRPPRCWFGQAGSPRPRDRSSSVADASARRGNRPGCEAGAWLRDDVALEARSARKYRRAAADDLGVEAKSRGAGPRPRLEGFNSRNPRRQAPPARCRLALAGGIAGGRSRNRGNPATAARLGLARDRAYHCLKCRATT